MKKPRMKIFPALTFLVMGWLPFFASAQPAPFRDSLLDHLAGDWVLRGTVLGKQTTHDIQASWVLGHQYLMFKETSRERDAKGEVVYAANVYIGWDKPTDQFVCMWLDVYGGISTQSIGRAKQDGNRIAFVFKNLDGKGNFQTQFAYEKAKDCWQMSMDSVKDGEISPFARTLWTRK